MVVARLMRHRGLAGTVPSREAAASGAPDLRTAHEANDRAVLVNVANVEMLPVTNSQ